MALEEERNEIGHMTKNQFSLLMQKSLKTQDLAPESQINHGETEFTVSQKFKSYLSLLASHKINEVQESKHTEHIQMLQTLLTGNLKSLTP